MAIYKLSPSDLTFSWEECKRCFYLKVRHNLSLRTAFPGMFGKMANLTSDYYQGRSTAEISTSLPPGEVKYREKFVKSLPIHLPGLASQCYISGRFDAVIEFEDGSYGVVDYKTSEARDEHAEFYSRQLTAYAYALENPAPGALHLAPVSRMGLFIITPERFEPAGNKEMVFVNRATWMDVGRDDAAFLALLTEVVSLLELPDPPQSSSTCPVCTYLASLEEFERLSAASPRLPGL